jgi:RND family efflux transporter MFP subunit
MFEKASQASAARVLASAVAAGALMIPGCHKNMPEPVPQAVRLVAVHKSVPAAAEHYSASFVPLTQVDLSFKSAGPVDSVLQVRGADGRVRDVVAGDWVEKGARLAVVRQSDYVQKLDQARQQARQADAQTASAEAAYVEASQDYRRAENLYAQASMTKPDYDQAKAHNDSTLQQLLAAKAAAEAAHTTVSLAQLNLSDTVVTAPFSGWVSARSVSKGSLVSSATLGFTLVDSSTVKAVFNVSDSSLGKIHLGDKFTVALDALAHPVNGVVTALSPVADAKSRVFSVEVSVPNAHNEIKPGMIGSIYIGGPADTRPRLLAPVSAVVRSTQHTGAFAIFVVREHDGKTTAELREVQLGDTYGNSIEVLSGIADGERVVTLGSELLSDGQLIRIL